MKIYIDNISINDIDINKFNTAFLKKKIKQYIYSDDGIFYFKNNTLNKLNITDVKIEKQFVNNFNFLIDKSIVNKTNNNYQIPLNYKIFNVTISYYKINNYINFIIFQDGTGKIIDFYFKSKNNIENYKDIVSFLLLF